MPLLLSVVIIALSVCVLLYFVKGYPSSDLSDWANFATYLGVSMSLISVIFIYLTYRSQVNMSSVLQFESTFFQWYQVHNELLKDLKPELVRCVNDVIIPKLQTSDFKNLSVFEQLARHDIPRVVHRYYKSMFQLLRYVESNSILTYYSQRKRYYDIIQSHLSDEELLVMLCFVLGDENKDKKINCGSLNKISIHRIVDKSHFLKNCYVDDFLLSKMVEIVRANFPMTAKESFHFFTEEAAKAAKAASMSEN